MIASKNKILESEIFWNTDLEKIKEENYKVIEKKIKKEVISKTNKNIKINIFANKIENDMNSYFKKEQLKMKYDKYSEVDDPDKEDVEFIEEELDKINFLKKEMNISVEDKEMNQYKNLLEDGLYDEVFILLDEKISLIENKIEKSKYVRSFFITLLDEDFLSSIVETEQLLSFAESVTDNIKNNSFLKEAINKITNYIDKEQIEILFVSLIKSNKFDKAEVLLPLVSKDLAEYPITIKNIVDTNNIEALRYLCENMNNIHYNNDALLIDISNMKPAAFKMLIEEYSFDINLKNNKVKNYSLNLVQALILTNKINNLEYITSSYGDIIDWNLSVGVNNKPVNYLGLLETVDFPNRLKIYNMLLEDINLNQDFVASITRELFKSESIVKEAVKTDVYYKLFSHPKYSTEVVNFKQSYFIYGIFTRIASAISENNDELGKNYLLTLEAYLTTRAEDEIPDATEYHILGAALKVGSNEQKSKILADAVVMIVKSYPQYINKPNPNGSLPIEQVQKDSYLYKVLVNNGAVPPIPVGFWQGLLGKKQKYVEQENNILKLEKSEVSEVEVNKKEITSLANKFKSDFKELNKYTESELCDPVIKFKCENMYLKTMKLTQTMLHYNIKPTYEDSHFLSENLSKYLTKSLSSYLTLCKAAEDFTVLNDKNSNETKENKLNNAKKQCEEHIDLLTEQLVLISENAAMYVSENAQKELNVTGRVIKKSINK